MVQKTKKVHFMVLQHPRKFGPIWTRFEILIFDPCFKKHAPDFFGDTLMVQNILKLNCHYEIGIVPKFGAPRITLGGSAEQNSRGGGESTFPQVK